MIKVIVGLIAGFLLAGNPITSALILSGWHRLLPQLVGALGGAQ